MSVPVTAALTMQTNVDIVEREEGELVETDFTEEWSTPPTTTMEYIPLKSPDSKPRPCNDQATQIGTHYFAAWRVWKSEDCDKVLH